MMFLRNLRTTFFKNLLTLVSYTIAAQIIAVIFQIFLRRLYLPADFGFFSVYLSCFGIVATIFSLRYEQTIIIPDSKQEAQNLLTISLLSCVFWFIVLLVFCVLFSANIVIWLKLPDSTHYLFYFFPFSVFFFSVYQAFNYWLIRQSNFKMSGQNKILRRFTEGIFQLMGGFQNWHSGLIIGDIAGNFINAWAGYFQCIKTGYKLKVTQVKNLLHSAYRYRHFPIYNLIPAILNAISLLIPVIIVNYHYSQEETGYFDLSRMVLGLPLALVATSYSQVLMQRLADKKNKKSSVYNIFKESLILLTFISALEVSFLSFWSEELFSFIFGINWCRAGTLTSILVFSYAVKFIVSPLSVVFTIFEKLKWVSVWQVIYFFSIIALFFIEVIPSSFFLILICIDIIAYFIYFIMILKVIKQYEKMLVFKSYSQ